MSVRADGGSRRKPRDTLAAADAVGQEHDDAGDHQHHHTQRQSQKPRPPHIGEIERGAAGQAKKGPKAGAAFRILTP